MRPNTLVIGGGIGGLAIAAALARQGAAVTLLEQADAIREVGAGLQITPNARPLFRALGLEAQLKRNAVQAQAVVLESETGSPVARLDVSGGPEAGYLFVHRADLVALLLQAARAQNVTINLGQQVKRVIPGSLPEVELGDGALMRAELVICADGLHSVGRRALNGEDKPTFTGQVAWRATIPQTQALPPDVRLSMGAGQHIVRYPLRGGALMNLVAVQEVDEWVEEGWHQAGAPDDLRRAFAQFSGPVARVLDRVTDVNKWGLFLHPVAETWVQDNVVLLGDAAHPTLPFLAQGANMALEDAAVLARCIETDQLNRYAALRQPRIRRVIRAAAGNARKYHLRPGPARFIAHNGLRLISAAAPGLLTRQFDWLYGADVMADLRP